jgi:cytoskeletal protein RodZ
MKKLKNYVMSYVRNQKRQLKRDFKDSKKRTKIVEIHNTKVRKQQKKDKRFEVIVTSCFMLGLIVIIALKLWKVI